MDTSKIKLIFDNNNSIYIGAVLSETQEYYLISNPAQIFYNVNPESKEVEINIIPVCFPEVLSAESKEKGTKWTYQKSNSKFVSVDDITLDSRVLSYYLSIFSKKNG
jgi:hypothetical protein